MEPLRSESFLGRESVQRRTTELAETATRFHRDFNKKVWSNNPKAGVLVGNEVRTPSYHHDGHIASTREAVNAFFTKAKDGVDPFQLNEELQKWNERNPQAQVQREDLPMVFEITYACHDLGNLTESSKFAPDGTLPFADQYLKEGAEARSAVLLDALVDRFLPSALNMTPERVESIKALGKHLVMQTVFDFGKTTSDEPFWQAVQVIDQFASYYFTNVPKESYIGGLLNEEKVRGEKAPNFRRYLEFPKGRLEAIVPDETQRAQVVEVLETNPYGKKEEGVYSISSRLGRIEELDRDVDRDRDIAQLIAV